MKVITQIAIGFILLSGLTGGAKSALVAAQMVGVGAGAATAIVAAGAIMPRD
jgi:hypothetical protein